MKSSTKKTSKFLKKPHTIGKDFGSVNAELTLRIAKNLPDTSQAMGRVAKEETKDDISKANGDDDYTASLRELFNAFDTFIREYSNGKSTAGRKGNYCLENDYELTIFLVWQIRNVWIHRGGVIDKRCKEMYDSAMKDASVKGINPIIDLPEEMKTKYEFTIDFDNYKIIREAIFKYIGNKISTEDLQILKTRASIKFDGFNGSLYMPIEIGIIEIDVEEAIKCGCDFNYDEFKLYFPEGCRYRNQKIFTSDGKSFQARLLDPANPKDSMMLQKFHEFGKPTITLSFTEKHKKFRRETFLTMEK